MHQTDHTHLGECAKHLAVRLHIVANCINSPQNFPIASLQVSNTIILVENSLLPQSFVVLTLKKSNANYH